MALFEAMWQTTVLPDVIYYSAGISACDKGQRTCRHRLHLRWWHRGYCAFLRVRWRWHLCKLQRRFTLCGSACLANACAGVAAPRLLGLLARPTSRASDGDGICARCNAGSPCMAVHVRPTLAPALVAQRLLGLLARPTAMVCVQVAT